MIINLNFYNNMPETLVNKYAVCKESGKDESHVYLVLFSGVQHASLEPTSPLSLLSSPACLRLTVKHHQHQ
jgi:hypothetical protein